MNENNIEMELCKKHGKYHLKRYPLSYFTKEKMKSLKLFIKQKKELIKELHLEYGNSISEICRHLEDTFYEPLYYLKKPYIYIIPEISKFILENILGYKNWEAYKKMMPKLHSKGRYKTGFTHKLKKEIKERDKNKCRICLQKKKVLVVHHIDGNRYNNDPKNLVTLCETCHIKIRSSSKKELGAILGL